MDLRREGTKEGRDEIESLDGGEAEMSVYDR